MKQYIKPMAVALLAFAGASAAVAGETPIIEFKTSLYDLYGPTNSFTFYLGGTAGEYIDVDCGFGTVEYELEEAVFDQTTSSIKATAITCTVSAAGTVKVYGNASAIDYFDATGCYISTIDFATLTNLEILDLEHNELTGLDLTNFSKLQAIYLADNPYSAATPLRVGPDKPDLAILQIGMSDYLDQSFNLSDYPSMLSFDAYAARDLRKIDPTGCPGLVQLTLDATMVESVDVSKNPKLQLLNVSDTRVRSLDVSGCPELRQLYATHGGAKNAAYKIDRLDVSGCPELVYLFAGYNNLTELDLSKNPKLFDLSVPDNHLTALDLSANKELYNVNIRKNNMCFATLPADPGSWGDFFYDQRPYEMNRSYKVGDVIDFSASMLREGTETVATLYYVNEDDPLNPIPAETDKYSYADGKLTLLKEITDSVFVTFDNSLFALYPLSTEHFVVKKEADFGQDVAALSMLPGINNGDAVEFTVGIDGASASAPRRFSVDFGDGNPVTFDASGSGIADGCKVTGIRNGSGYLTVYVPEGTDITALEVDGITLYSIDFNAAADMLRELTLKGTGLYSIDLERLRCLRSVNMTGNNLYTFSIKGKNYNFVKTTLTDLIVPSNGISVFEFDDLESLERIDLSYNNIEELDLSLAKRASDINLSHNRLTAVDMSACAGLVGIDMTSNSISDITLPAESVLETLRIGDNAMTLANLPDPSLFTTYSYAPQARVGIPVKGPGADLSSQYVNVGGATTQYAWFTSEGLMLTEGIDYTVSEGKTRFLNSSLGKVYCAMTHAAFPEFSIAGGTALLSTEIETAPMPTNVVASFTTPVGGESVSLSLAATAPNTSVFIDWKGDGIDLISYDLDTTYRLFEGTTSAGAEVKVYTYEDGASLSVFSVSGATMGSVDLSKLKNAVAITLSDAKLSEVTLPESNVLREINLNGNRLSALDLSGHLNVYSLSLSDNLFSGTIDLTPYKDLELISLGNNKLTGIKLDNPGLWFLDLAHNSFETIDLSGAPALNQLGLSGNSLSTIDVSFLTNLRGLTLDANRFTFATLPPVKPSYSLYIYANQARINAPVDGNRVDLSDQAAVDGTATEFTWFLDEPQQDEEGNWVGEELIADDEYTIENGVTTFNADFVNVIGLLTNEAFPDLDLFTTAINVSGVENVAVCGAVSIRAEGRDIVIESDGQAGTAAVYSVAGQLVRKVSTVAGRTVVPGLASGVYVVAVGDTVAKVAVR